MSKRTKKSRGSRTIKSGLHRHKQNARIVVMLRDGSAIEALFAGRSKSHYSVRQNRNERPHDFPRESLEFSMLATAFGYKHPEVKVVDLSDYLLARRHTGSTVLTVPEYARSKAEANADEQIQRAIDTARKYDPVNVIIGAEEIGAEKGRILTNAATDAERQNREAPVRTFTLKRGALSALDVEYLISEFMSDERTDIAIASTLERSVGIVTKWRAKWNLRKSTPLPVADRPKVPAPYRKHFPATFVEGRDQARLPVAAASRADVPTVRAKGAITRSVGEPTAANKVQTKTPKASPSTPASESVNPAGFLASLFANARDAVRHHPGCVLDLDEMDDPDCHDDCVISLVAAAIDSADEELLDASVDSDVASQTVLERAKWYGVEDKLRVTWEE